MTMTYIIDSKTTIDWQNGFSGRHTITVNGTEVYNQKHYRSKTEIDFNLPDGRKGQLKASRSLFNFDYRLTVDGELMLPEFKGVKRECTKCKASNPTNAKTCEKCGAELPSKEISFRKGKVREASNMIRLLAGIFVLFGGIMCGVQFSQAKTVLQKIERFQDSDPVTRLINGHAYTAGEIRSQVRRAPWIVLILNVFLGAVMLGLSFWANTSPLSALMIAAGIYLAVNVGNAIYDPTTIAQGWLLKGIVIVALVKGMRAALELPKENV